MHEGMNCHSLSEPIRFLIRDVPYTTVGKQDPRRPADKYLFRYRGGNMDSHSSCLPLTPVTPGRSATDDGRKEEGGRRESAFVSVGQFRFRPVEVLQRCKTGDLI